MADNDENVARFPQDKVRAKSAIHADPADVIRLEIFRGTHPPSPVPAELIYEPVPPPPVNGLVPPDVSTFHFPPLPPPGVSLMSFMTYRSEPVFGGHKITEVLMMSAVQLAKAVVPRLEAEVLATERAIELVKKVTDNNGTAIGVLYAIIAELTAVIAMLKNVK